MPLVHLQMLLPFMMSSRYASLHEPTIKRQWRGLVCIGIFMVRLSASRKDSS